MLYTNNLKVVVTVTLYSAPQADGEPDAAFFTVQPGASVTTSFPADQIVIEEKDEYANFEPSVCDCGRYHGPDYDGECGY